MDIQYDGSGIDMVIGLGHGLMAGVEGGSGCDAVNYYYDLVKVVIVGESLLEHYERDSSVLYSYWSSVVEQ